jgi:2-keto-4-pentenoate hydratase/2-oxohepta-3-ene-1,7-dioic acid hydratase in catechol pathway
LIPRFSPAQIDWECELGIVIGRRCRHVDEDEAMGCIAGYTVVNDISDRAFKPNPRRKPRDRDKFFDWMHGKWHDTFCPMGPCVLSAHVVADPQALPITLSVNGRIMQNASTAEMIFPVPAIVSFLSEFVTLQRGDVIATGTPAGVGSASGTFLRAGDFVRAAIGPIGTLENPVEDEDDDDL